MENKLSLTDVAELLSQRTGCTKKTAEQFLKELFAEASAVISSGESLKIYGLGTFKSVWVAPRNSVNVRSGESFEIPGHYKLSFVPDKKMKDAVNAPFADFETVVLSDHVNLAAMADTADSSEGTQSEDTVADKQETIPPGFDSGEKLENQADKGGHETVISDKEDVSQLQDESVSDILEQGNIGKEDDSEIDTLPLKKSYGWSDVAKALKDMLARRGSKVDIVIGLDVPEAELIDRLLKRGKESGRSDDNLETIKKRLDVYHNQTSPLRDHYIEEGIYAAINGLGSIEKIFEDIKNAIDNCRK